jgi:hypothetical protein
MSRVHDALKRAEQRPGFPPPPPKPPVSKSPDAHPKGTSHLDQVLAAYPPVPPPQPQAHTHNTPSQSNAPVQQYEPPPRQELHGPAVLQRSGPDYAFGQAPPIGSGGRVAFQMPQAKGISLEHLLDRIEEVAFQPLALVKSFVPCVRA